MPEPPVRAGRTVAPKLWSAPIARDPRAVGDARRAIRHLLERHGVQDAVGDVQLLVTELLTNALIHTDSGQVQLTVVRLSEHVRVEVADAGGAGPVAPREPSLDGGGGFGLHIVDAIADDWGVRDGSSTVVWAMIAA